MTKGQRIKSKREALNISQTDLAKKIGVSKQTLYKYENDIVTNIPSDIIEKMSYQLECEPSYIMGWDDKETIEVTTRDMEKAAELYALYKKAIPEIQSAVETLLKAPKSDF
jgi:transcriptional regulator with XRE-family HTH domain